MISSHATAASTWRAFTSAVGAAAGAIDSAGASVAGALTSAGVSVGDHDHVKDVLAALDDPETVVVAQHAPAVSVTLAEEFALHADETGDGGPAAALSRYAWPWRRWGACRTRGTW